MIPKQIFFCNGVIDSNSIASVHRWKTLNPEYSIYLYDNKMCYTFLKREFGEKHAKVFDFIKDGPIKADFWRLCVLYKMGGVYSDIDNVPKKPLSEVIRLEAHFVVPTSYWLRMGFRFNPNFIMCYQKDEIIKKCIEWYINKYDKKHIYQYWGWSIMKCFNDTIFFPSYKRISGIYKVHDKNFQLLLECEGKKHTDAHTDYGGKVFFYNRCENWDYINHRFV